MADLRGRQGHAPPYRSKFFNFHAVFGNNFAIGKNPENLGSARDSKYSVSAEIHNVIATERAVEILSAKTDFQLFLVLPNVSILSRFVFNLTRVTDGKKHAK